MRKCGVAVVGEDGELRPGTGRAVTRTVAASIRFGIATGYLTLTGSYGVPGRLKTYL